MRPALTPALALDYLRELSADLRDGVVLGPSGEYLAGVPAMAAPAAELLAALGAAPAGQALLRAGAVFVARAEGLAVAIACGPRALPGLALHDLRLVLSDLGAQPTAGAAPAQTPADLPAGPAGALISAAQRGAGE